jgi:putative glycosyltransferase
MPIPEISIVTSLYRSEKYLEAFIQKCDDIIKEIGFQSYELIAVNDGSPDNSLNKILELKERYPYIKVIDLSRNFGHHYAFFSGMNYSKGYFVFNIDCDLEVEPKILKKFYDEIQTNRYDVVYGIQIKRKGRLVEKYFGGLFWKTFNLLSEIKIPENILTERLMTRNYVNNLLQIGDKNLFLAGIMHWTGFNQKGILVSKALRSGKSTYSFTKRFKLFVQAVTSFSAYPLKLLFNAGVILTSVSFAYGSFLLIEKLINPKRILPGYTSLIVVILFSTGLIVASLGIIGIYVEKIFNQVRQRPLTIIKNIYE